MFCSKCGAQLADGTAFCNQCGNKVGAETVGVEVVNPQVQVVPVEVRPGLADAIIVTIFCCMPFGIVGIVFAALSKGAIAAGDYERAKRHARTARIFTWLGFGIGLVGTIIYVLFYGLLAGL
ncbi:MAG: zinc-ribbon domain-containing protein [Lentisphaerae bacterium]|nr:zinc-ribbon domain-containing protein [Lentisphaerota bacterium]MBQ9804293.1 CD225/dispanin family protein [Lentisphaeria bacterium]